MIPGPRATIDLQALTHNLQISRKHTPHSKQLAVIKANAYGHGLLQVAEALKDADALAVARLPEAIQLRESGIDKTIVLLEGVITKDELKQAQEYELELVVHHQDQLALLEQLTGEALIIWLKVDSGMHRLGILPEDTKHIYARLDKCQSVKQIRLMTHLANADDRNDSYTDRQCDQFKQAIAGLNGETSIANSAGIVGWPDSHADWARPGIMLYGASPLMGVTANELELKPVMTLTSNLIAVNAYRKGDAIGYGSSWICPEDMQVGVVAIGYGDGYPRHAQSGTPVLIKDQKCETVGRVSMDMLCVDLRHCPAAKVGDAVTLWGKDLPVEDISNKAGTISYELFCRLTSRVEFVYQDS
ncbi:MAG: alanine racemase [Gammaproteobacteria bacterium]|nr:alanine racemase [Gammaproteobacteria bacterium]